MNFGSLIIVVIKMKQFTGMLLSPQHKAALFLVHFEILLKVMIK